MSAAQQQARQAVTSKLANDRAKAAAENRANFPTATALADKLRATSLGNHVRLVFVSEGGKTLGKDINEDDFVTIHIPDEPDPDQVPATKMTAKERKQRQAKLPSWKRKVG